MNRRRFSIVIYNGSVSVEWNSDSVAIGIWKAEYGSLTIDDGNITAVCRGDSAYGRKIGTKSIPSLALIFHLESSVVF
jgi:hypothetical protein